MFYYLTRMNIINFKTLKMFKKSIFMKIIHINFYLSLAFTYQAANAEEILSDNSVRYSGGVSMTTVGLGLSLSSLTSWSLIAGDQVQWRFIASHIDSDFDGNDDVELGGTDYEDGDFSVFSFRGGVDWYPLNKSWTDEVFLSSGFMFIDGELEGSADNSKNFSVGNIQVTPGDITSLKTSIEHTSIRPYLSLGWGNKITSDGGFDFQAEIGFSLLTSDPKVKLLAVDPGDFLTQSALAAEKKEIEEDFKKIVGFATATISYQF
jgi:hypothetical protein